MSALTLRLVPLGRETRISWSMFTPKSLLVYVMTVGRLALAVAAVHATVGGRPWVAVALIAVFVVIDIYDGVLARSFGIETGLRRGLDGVIDKVSIHLVALFVCTTLPGGIWIWACLLARDIAQALIGGLVLGRLRVVAAGAKWHRAFTLLVAIWGTAAIVSGDTVRLLAYLMLAIGLLSLVDYARQCRLLLRSGQLPRRFALEADSLSRRESEARGE